MMPLAGMLALAIGLEGLMGWPAWLNKRISHPVAWIGALISVLDGTLNRGNGRQRFWRGAATVALILGTVAIVTVGIVRLLPESLWADGVQILLMASLLASRNLHDHVRAVAQPLGAGDIVGARSALALIVGRNPEALDASAISRAAIESLAENASDGVIAPLFWGLVAGLPGMAIYKAINTLDSMIGYHGERYEHFGKFAARLDDVVNWIPARLTALLFLAWRPRLFGAARMEAGKHRSPNAGWPESAMARLLAVRLSGPRTYQGRATDDPWLNADGGDATPDHIDAALTIYAKSITLVFLGLLVWWGAKWIG